MAENNLIILTSQFPVVRGEPWLSNEVKNISGNWKKLSVFCEANKELAKIRECPQFELLPNTFVYKRNLLCFFNRYFLIALLTEIQELLDKKKFRKLIFKSVSLLMQKYQMARWFGKEYINRNENYMLYSYWGNENATMICFVKIFNKNVNAICRVHRFDIYGEISQLGHIRFRKFQLINLASMFSVSEAGSDYIRARYPQFKTKVKTSYLGTTKPNLLELNPIPLPGRMELLSCAIASDRKKLDLIIKTIGNMKIPVRWTLAGDGREMSNLKSLCNLLPPNAEVEFLGFLDANQIMNLYKTKPVHYYISLSASEGLPVAMMESISFGIPIISTNVGGCNEIVNDISGVLISPDFDVINLAQTIENLYQQYDYSPAKRKEIYLEWERKFNAIKNYESFYEQLLNLI